MDLFGEIVQSVLLTEGKKPTVSDVNDAINGLKDKIMLMLKN